jgi:hypothetical protein
MPRLLILSGLSMPSERLPERVRRAIARQEEDSEKLIGWVQLAIVLVFVILYTVSPKTFDQSAVSFEPVPLALGGYALFTVIRLALAYGKRLPGWFLYLSMVIDQYPFTSPGLTKQHEEFGWRYEGGITRPVLILWRYDAQGTC